MNLAAGAEWHDHDLVFASVPCRHLDKKADWKAWKALLAKAAVRDVRLHDGRSAVGSGGANCA